MDALIWGGPTTRGSICQKLAGRRGREWGRRGAGEEQEGVRWS